MPDKVPVKATIKEGETYPLPANMPDSYEVTCKADAVLPVDWDDASAPGGGTILTFARALETDPSEHELAPGATLIVATRRSEYQRLDELDRYVQSSYLSDRGITIEVRTDPSGE